MIKLPMITNPWIQAYQIRNFELGILQNKIPWVYGKYINCFYEPQEDAKFNHVMSEGRYYWREKVFMLQKFRYNRGIFDLNLIDFVSWAKGFLDNEWYIMGYFDEFYIPAKARYHKMHFRHSMFIYGYNDEEKLFYAIGYTDGRKYRPFTLTYSEYIAAIKSDFDRTKEEFVKRDIDKIEFDVIKINPNFKFEFNLREIYTGIDDYLNSVDSNNKIQKGLKYGINCEKCFANYIKECLETDDYLDVRFSRVFMELKEIMYLRLGYLEEKSYIRSETAERYKLLAAKQTTIHALFLKYNITKNEELIARMLDIMDEIIASEISILFEVRENLLNILSGISREEYI